MVFRDRVDRWSRRALRHPVVIVPGWTNSGPHHWQSQWQRMHPTWLRVEQEDWENPDPDQWVDSLQRAVSAAEASPILVCHSLGCLTAVRWAAGLPQAPAVGALLVAPPDVERNDTPEGLRAFRPVPMERISFPTLLVASRTDPYLTWERAHIFATAWGGDLRDAGPAGHINTDAGFGPWPEGLRWLDELIGICGTTER